jgi:hypothetical protein
MTSYADNVNFTSMRAHITRCVLQRYEEAAVHDGRLLHGQGSSAGASTGERHNNRLAVLVVAARELALHLRKIIAYRNF